jgi:CubicO group peptidase (beta-lactamase class C family)
VLKALENIVDEPIRGWAHTNFYARLGITDYEWQRQPDGYPEGAARMFIRPRDMLKVGVTYLNNGKWNGEQVIPESWVQKCMEVQEVTASGKYSHYFWIRELKGLTYLSADGDGGNFINIFPEENMVIVFTQGNYLQWPLYVNQANDIMGNYIIPAIQ